MLPLTVQGTSVTCQEIYRAPTRWHQNRWTADKIVAVIIALKEAGLPVYGTAVKKGGQRYKEIVEETLGYPGSLKRLVESKPEPSWTWNIALAKAGLDPVVERAYKDPWTVDEITTLLQEFNKKGLALNRVSVLQGGKEYQDVAKQILGREVSLERLVNVKPTKDWTWETALTRAGFDPQAHIAKKHAWTAGEIVLLIKAFHEADLKTNVHAVRKGGKEYDRVMEEVMGFSHGTQGIISAKPYPGWNWQNARIIAGVPLRKFSLPRPFKPKWHEENIVLVLQAFAKAGLPLNMSAVRRGGEQYSNLVFQTLGYRLPLTDLVTAKPTENWTWPRAIQKAGFDPYEHVTPHHNWSRQDIILMIQTFAEAGLPINFRNVFDGGEAYQKLIFEVIGVTSSSRSIVRAKPEENWRWDQALVEAGFNPNEVRLNGSAPFHLLTAEMKAELVSNYEATYGRYGSAFETRGRDDFERVATVDPAMENQVHQKQISEVVSEISSDMSPRQQRILDGLLEFVETRQEFNLPDMLRFLREEDPTLEISDLQMVMSLLKDNPQVQNLMSN